MGRHRDTYIYMYVCSRISLKGWEVRREGIQNLLGVNQSQDVCVVTRRSGDVDMLSAIQTSIFPWNTEAEN